MSGVVNLKSNKEVRGQSENLDNMLNKLMVNDADFKEKNYAKQIVLTLSN